MVLNQTCLEYQVIVVDQSRETARELASYLEAHKDRVEYYRLPRPNLPAARNFGIRKATGEVVIFIDDDVQIPRDYVASHLVSYDDETVAGVTGLTFSGAAHTLDDAIAAAQMRGDPSDAPVPVKWLGGNNMSYRRKVLVEAGLFDERFTGSAWAEDADMSVRVRRLGHQLVLNPKIRLLHLALPSGGCQNRDQKSEDRVLMEHFRLWLFYYIKNRDMVEVGEVMKTLYWYYRAIALNRKVVREGIKTVLDRHWLFVGALARGVRRGPDQRGPDERAALR
jgi:glycosyltransferase involved in cell wall biosynthesis